MTKSKTCTTKTQRVGKGTAVTLKSDSRRGVSACDRDHDGEISVRFDDGSEDWSNTDDVLAVGVNREDTGFR